MTGCEQKAGSCANSVACVEQKPALQTATNHESALGRVRGASNKASQEMKNRPTNPGRIYQFSRKVVRIGLASLDLPSQLNKDCAFGNAEQSSAAVHLTPAGQSGSQASLDA